MLRICLDQLAKNDGAARPLTIYDYNHCSQIGLNEEHGISLVLNKSATEIHKSRWCRDVWISVDKTIRII